jgi:hypothetical protein
MAPVMSCKIPFVSHQERMKNGFGIFIKMQLLQTSQKGATEL